VTDAAAGGPRFVIVGRIRRPHGLEGALAVEPLTDAPDVVLAPGRRLLAGTSQGDLAPGGAELHVTASDPLNDGVVLYVAEVQDRDGAERWRGRYLLVPADELPQRSSDEVYLHELVGLRVEKTNGDHIGVVDGYYDLPQGLILEVRDGERTFLLPYRDQFVRQVNVGAQVMVVDVPEGLLE
jgi:16S rRNA processing protein RimM